MEMLEALLVALLRTFILLPWRFCDTLSLVLHLPLMLGMNLFFFADPSNMYHIDLFHAH